MMNLVFTICLAVFASTHAVLGKVTTAEFPECNTFFYRNTPPTGFTSNNYRAICQLYQSLYRFATLYDVGNRIPVYSAYRLDDLDCGPNQPARRSLWFIEPQLSNSPSTSAITMTTSGGPTGEALHMYTDYQAVNKDYERSGYDRGHLNPCFYNCYNNRTATFTLTNAVPQNPTFNRNKWKRQEALAKSTMKTDCPTGKRYFVTGATPSTGNYMPNTANRVNVPSELWSAACCDTGNLNTDFSIAFTGKNTASSNITPQPVHALEAHIGPGVKIFEGGCGSTSSKSNSVINGINNVLVG